MILEDKMFQKLMLKLRHCEKATKFEKKSTTYFGVTRNVGFLSVC